MNTNSLNEEHSLSNGRRIKCITVAEDFIHECVDIAVVFGIAGQNVTRLLDQAAIFRGYPDAVRTDNGPEFTSRAFLAWASLHGIRHILIQPGRPMQNGYIEIFNGKFRDECLNEHCFKACHKPENALLNGAKTSTKSGPQQSGEDSSVTFRPAVDDLNLCHCFQQQSIFD
jgi:putative transposase